MSLLNDCYISYLNLDHRTDRREHMEKELARVGINAVRTRGKLPEEFDLTDQKLQVMKNRTPGAIGCHYGMIEIMAKALAAKKNCWILEDDVQFASDIKKRINIFEEFLNKQDNWDIAWLGGTFHVNLPYWHKYGHNPELQQCNCNLGKDAECTENPHIMRTYGSFSTFSWIINFNSLENVMSLLEENVHQSMGIDWDCILISPQLKTFAFVSGACRQIDNRSDIGNGDTIFSNFSKLNGSIENSRYWFTDLMEEFDPTTFDWAECKNIVT